MKRFVVSILAVAIICLSMPAYNSYAAEEKVENVEKVYLINDMMDEFFQKLQTKFVAIANAEDAYSKLREQFAENELLRRNLQNALGFSIPKFQGVIVPGALIPPDIERGLAKILAKDKTITMERVPAYVFRDESRYFAFLEDEMQKMSAEEWANECQIYKLDLTMEQFKKHPSVTKQTYFRFISSEN